MTQQDTELERVEGAVLTELKEQWETWQTPLRVYTLCAPYNRKLKLIGEAPSVFIQRLSAEKKLLLLRSPLGKKFVFPIEALENYEKDDLLEQLREADRKEV